MRKNTTATRSLKGSRFINLRRQLLSAAIIAASQTAWVTPAIAGPDGGSVVGGDGSIGRDGRNITIHQRSDRMAIDWDSYNVAADEVVTYIQPSRDSVALNRILSHSGSEIHGQINANGQVVLVNPHGVFFGKDAQVNVGGLIASGMTVDVSDFMNGDFTFSAVDGADGKVINQGLINAATGGSVTLLGKQVRNDGLISARLGAVNLAAGKEAVVTFDEAGLMGVRISKEILQDELGVDAAVLNTGEITAQGGRILLSASTSRDIFSQAVNRGDLQQATSAVVHEDGSFTLGGGADVVNTGILNVSSADRGAGDIVVLGENITQAGTVSASTQSGTSGSIELHAAHTALLTDESLTAARAEGRGQGGQIKVLGHHVGLTDQATVDASGAWGGGEVYIGGDYQGDNPFMPNAWRSFVGEQTHIKANALAHGDGGRIIVWADDITRFFGDIEGQGAGRNGKGGFAEVSGKNQLRFDGLADMRGSGGIGTLLLDPRDIVITWGGDKRVGPDVSFSDGGIDEDFHIRPDTLQSNLVDANVKLEATRDIFVEDVIAAHSDNTHSLTLWAGRNIAISSQINLFGGDLALRAGVAKCGEVACYPEEGPRSVEISGELRTQGAIEIWAADNITLDRPAGTDTNRATSVTLRAGNDITIGGSEGINVRSAPDANAIKLIAGDTTLFSEGITVAPVDGGDGNLVIGGNLNSYGTDDARGGNIFLNATGQLTLSGDVITQGGHFTVGTNNGTRPAGFSMIDSTVNTGTASGGTGLDAGNIAIYTAGNADLGVLDLSLNHDTVNNNGGANSIGTITVDAGENITLHNDLDFNNFGPRTRYGERNSGVLGESGLRFTAGRNITLNGEIFDEYGDSRDALNIDLNADDTLTLNNNVYTSGGNLTASAGEIIFGSEGAISTRFANYREDTVDEGPDDPHGYARWSTGGNVTLNAVTQMMLGNVVTHLCDDIASCTGNLTLSGVEMDEAASSLSITQLENSHLGIAGTTAINIGTGTATLDRENNEFHGAVSGHAHSLEIVSDEAGLVFGALTLTGNLTATAAGDITDREGAVTENIIQVDGVARFNTNGNTLSLANREHQLSAVEVLGQVREVELKNGRSLDVGAITTTGEGGAIDLVADGTLTVGKLDANGRDNGYGGGEITLEANEVTLQGDISSRGSEGSGEGSDGASGNITISGDTVIDVSGWAPITVDNTGGGESVGHSGNFELNGTLNGANGWASITINSGNVTFNGNIGNRTELEDLIINTYGNVAFNIESFPQAYRIRVHGQANDHKLTAPDVAGEWFILWPGEGDLSARHGGGTWIEFINMATLVGSNFGDQFNIHTIGSVDLSIIGNRPGGGGNGTVVNTVVASNRDNLWNLDGGDKGTLNDSLRFNGIHVLQGGSRSDQFVLSGDDLFTGTLKGGTGGGNSVTSDFAEGRWALSDHYNGTLAVGGHELRFENIQSLEGSGRDSLKGLNQANVWHWTPEGGSVALDDPDAPDSFALDFSGMNELIGGGVADRLNSNTANGTWVMTAQNEGALTVPVDEQAFVLNFKDMQTLEGSGSDSLEGLNQKNVWHWAPEGGSVALDDPDATDSFSIDFSGMNHLIGGGAADRLSSSTANSTWVMTEPHKGTLAVSVDEQEFALSFEGMDTLEGSGTDALTRHDQNSHWLITALNSGRLQGEGGIENDNTTYFSGMNELIGGSNSDHFAFGSDGAITGRIDGGGTDDGVINTIVGRDTDNYWEIGVADGAQRGSITDVTDTDDDPIGFTYLKEFTGIHSLVGGDGTDQFVYMEGGQHIALDGGGGDDNSVDFSRLGSMDVRLNEGPMSRVTNIQTLIGGGAGFTIGVVDGNSRWKLDGEYSGVLLHDSNGNESFDAEYTFINFVELIGGSGVATLVADDVENHWTLNSSDGGTLESRYSNAEAGPTAQLTFSGMDHLIGGTEEDHFVLSGAEVFRGTLDGGEGVGNSLASDFENGIWALIDASDGTLTVGGHELHFKNIQTLEGSGSDALTRHVQNSQWLITSINAGKLMESDENDTGGIENGNTTYFSGMSTLIGGSNSDHFVFGADGAITGRIDGGGTDDGVINTIFGRDTDNYWEIGVADGAQRGSITDVTDTDDDPLGFTYLKEFTGIHSLVGGEGADQFVYMNGSDHIALDGGGGDDNSVDFSRLGSMDVRLNRDVMTDITNIQTLIGGGAGFTIGVVNGNSRWELDGEYSGVLLHDSSGDESFDAEYTFINFVELIGGSGVATLVADDVDNHWTLNSSDGGTLESRYSETEGEPAAQLTFSGMDRLIGGTEKDHFVLSGAEFFRGTLDGGEGVGNSLASEFNNGNWALTENYDGTLTVNQNALHFYNMQTLEGSGSDSLKGLSQKNVWHWSPEGGSVALDEPDAPDSFAIDFSGMNRLIGGGVADRLNSETDNGKWVMTEPHKGTLTVSGDELRFEDMQTLAGSGTDTLNRHEENNHWLITSTNGGMLLESDENGAGWIENGNTTYFSGMNALIGGSNSDHFVLEVLFAGTLEGGDNTTGNSIKSNLEEGAWQLTGAMEGILNNDLTFQNIQTLLGGRGNDSFSLDDIDRDALSSFSLIDGGTQGENTLDLTGQSGNESLIIAVAPGSYEGAHLNIRGIHTLTAKHNGRNNSHGNTLVGPDLNATWTVTGADKGTLAYTEALDDNNTIGRKMEFEGFANLLGGRKDDRFDVEDGPIAGDIDGGEGINWLDYSAAVGDIVVPIGSSGDASSAISNIQGIIGNHDPDAANPFNSRVIVGNAAPGSINEWLIALLDEHNLNESISDGINDGVYNLGKADQFYFINFNQLVGGEGHDTFTFSGAGQLTGSINGGAGTNIVNALDSSLGHSFSFNDTAEQGVFIKNINEVKANSAHSNKLLGANEHNLWSITSVGGGILNEQITFEGFDHLIGGSDLDQFVLSGAGRVDNIDGGGTSAGGPNTVLLEESLNHPLLIGLGTSDADIQLVNIGGVSANASDGHILVGSDQNNTWHIDDENAGTVNNEVSFSGFRFLRGNTADDTFVIAGGGVVTGNLDGGDGDNNALDLSEISAARALTIALNDEASADLVIKNINAVNSRADAEHTLVADNRTNIWSITGTNTGELAELSFNGMANLVGGQLDDTFVFSAAGDITGLIDGGGHETENTLDYSRVAGADIGLGKDNDFINIQHLIGDNISSTLRAADQNNHWSLSDGVNAGTLNGGLRFTGITNLVGGSTHDVFTVNGGALTGAIYAGKGSGALNLSIKPGTSGQLRFFGGEGDNQILVNGGGVSYKARYAVDTAGEESLSYTGASGVHYELLYRDVTEVRDNVFADTLELVGGSHTEELVLSGNRFSVPGYSDLRFHNKHNLTVAATSQNHLKLEGRLDIPGTFEVRNARVSQDDNQARIEARRLILTGVAGFGSEGQSVNTHVDEVDIRLGRADLYLSNLGSLSLNELSGSGTIRVETEGALNSARDLKHSGSTSFISRFSDITLTGGNLLSGDITLAASGNIILKNTRDTRLQGVQAHNLSLTSEGDITAPGVLTVDGLTALAADGDISLVNSKNNLRELEIQQAENVTVHAGHWMDLSSVYSRGDVYTRTEGLNLSGRITANDFQFDAGAGASVLDGQLNVSTLLGRAQGITVKKGISIDTIELDSRGGTLALEAELETLQSMALRGRNVDQMAAIISGADLRVSSNANYNQRADTTAREDLRVTAESDITMETGVLSRSQSGEIHYQAGNSIALGGLDASGSTVSLTASRGAISNINNSDVNVTADRLEMHAATGIGRQTSLLTDIHVLNAQTQTGRLALVNQADLQVDRMASNGNVRLSNRTGHIYLNTQDGPVFNTAESDALLAGGTLTGNYDLGTVVVEVPDGSLYGLGQAHAQKPDLVGREVIMLAPNGTVGSRNRPLVVYAKDLSSTIAGHTWPMWWAFDVRPNQVENDSGIPQELLDFASAGSHQMVEVESLEDINPAIFTEVRNYTYSNISVLLPPDQRYDDDDNQ